ncbi:MAG: DUF4118 domain-containing protein [Anaerolineales bacterium]|nr:DUF4118 domain-containing protein [Anaerolineales bacterium]
MNNKPQIFSALHSPATSPNQSGKFYLSYFFSLLIVVAITGVGLLIRDLVTPTNLVMPYLLGVVSIAVLWGRGPAIFASVLGVLAFDIFLVPPYLTFVVEDTEYIITFLSLFLVGVLISNLTVQIKEQMLEAKEREARATSLYQLSQALAVAFKMADVLNAIVDNIRNTLDIDVELYLLDRSADPVERLEFDVFPQKEGGETQASEEILSTLRTGISAGLEARGALDRASIAFPLVTNSGIVGAINFSSKNPLKRLDKNDFQTYDAVANLSALAIERVYLNQEVSQTQLLKAKEELQSALLNSISHDFRTPLVTITGTLSSLETEIHLLEKDSQQHLIRQALNEAERLNRLVSNLLNIIRLEGGSLQLQWEPVDVQDLIGTTLEQLKNRIDRQINIELPDQLSFISADFVLLQQVLINLIENASKYSPEGTPIDIIVHREDGWLYIDVGDRGDGIDEKEIPHIFKKFYRMKDHEKLSGTGLGLAIVKGIMDAHHAQIKVIPRYGGGMVFRLIFTYPEYSPLE